MEALQETSAIVNAELRRMLRSGRVVVLLLLYALFSLMVLLVVGYAAQRLQVKLDEALAQGGDADALQRSVDQSRQQMLGFLFSQDGTALEALARLPVVILVTFRITLLFLPLYVALMGFDQVSGEVAPKSIRFLTVRSRRSAILLGKFLAQASVLLGLVLVIDLAIFVYAKATVSSFTLGLATLTLLRFWIAAIVYSLAYLALTTLCSTLFRLPAVSLISNILALFAFWLIDVVGIFFDGKAKLDPEAAASPLRYLGSISPSHYAGHLLDPSWSRYGLGAGAYAGFALLFLLLAYVALRRRDL